MEDEIYKVDDFEYSINTDVSGNEYLAVKKYNGDATELTIPSTVTIDGKEYPVAEISESAFESCVNLTSVTIPDSVTEIGDCAFEGCKSLTSIEIPNSVMDIGGRAFAFCESLETIAIPDSVGERIECDAFLCCDNITSIRLPKCWEERGATGLRYMGLDPSNPNLKITYSDQVNMEDKIYKVDDFEYSINIDEIGDAYLAVKKYNGDATELTIPSTVTIDYKEYPVVEISESAFESCVNLTSVTIPDSVDSILSGAFEGCKSLTSIEIPNTVDFIGGRAFAGCESLTSITIPDSVIGIGFEAFGWCTSLEKVKIPDSVGKRMECDAFRCCDNITSIRLPKCWEKRGATGLRYMGLDPSNPNLKITYDDQGQGQNENVGLGNIQVDKPVIGACNLTGASKPKTPTETPVKSRK